MGHQQLHTNHSHTHILTMITLHHLDQSRSQRIIWLLEELGLEYELKTYLRSEAKRAPPELREIHPLGKSPVITDGSLTVAESGAIVAYLLKKGHPHAAPRHEARLRRSREELALPRQAHRHGHLDQGRKRLHQPKPQGCLWAYR